jgi:hypothetical protein
MSDTSVRRARMPAEIVTIVGAGAAIFFVVASGLGLSSVLPDPSPWLIAAAYLAPAGLAFAAYWWVAQRT